MKKIMNLFVALVLFLPFSAVAQTDSLKNLTDEAGKKQGYWEKLDEDGKTIYTGTFVDDVPVDTFKYYYKSGTPWSVTAFSQNGKVAFTQMYSAAGKKTGEGKYIDQKRDSLWRFFDEAGETIATETYKNGIKDGVAVVYYSNGELAEVKHWKNGLLDGDCKRYFQTGQLKDHRIYKEGKVEGIALYFHPNGKRACEGVYKNDLKNGMWRYYDENGELTREDEYIDSRYVGKDDPNVIPKEQVEREKEESQQYEIDDPFNQR